ncbi:protocadherin alpha-7-like [Kryptolebias marmoratus]|uniref:protocadherin alpha-7-like n=1 Tax=Kryptolebias marmoratus TaxID=37003 RepID=UPI0007F8EE16|nr:protocadherin alpha-7-like [Kryptolebias marmoratus]
MEAGGQSRGIRSWCVAFSFSVMLSCVEPTSAQIKYSIPEEVKVGSLVGNIAKDLGLEISSLAERRFRIVSGADDVQFKVNPNNGVLFVQETIDREKICESVSSCLINLKLVAENPMEIHYVGVEIIDVNDNSPSFQEVEKFLEISESTPPGKRFQLPTARDPDVTVNTVRVYKLNHNEHFSLQIRERGEDKIPFLVLQKSLDREKNNEHRLILTALDSGNPQRSGTLNVTVTVLDSNDNHPMFSQEVYSVTVPENVNADTSVITVNATDKDEGVNGEIEYFFGDELDPQIYDMFSLDKASGEIRVKGVIDFEEADVFKLDVHATDKGHPPMSSDCRVIIKVLDDNDNKPEIEVTSLSKLVSEDSKPGTVVSLISITDRDSSLNGKVICSLSDNVPFDLKPSFQDNMYSLVLKQHLDRESMSHYDVTITATDCGQPPLSTFRTLSVDVTDVNDNAPEFLRNPIELYLTENNVPGNPIYSVSASDKDLGENAAIGYYLVREESSRMKTEVTDHSLFGLDRYTGQIRTLRSFTETDEAEHKLLILVKDNGNVSLSATATVIVKLVEPKEAFAASDIKSATKDDEENNVTFYLIITLGSVSVLFLISIIVLIAMQCSKSTDYTSKYLQEANYDGTLCHSIQYRSGDKRYMLVGPRMSIGSTIVPGSHANTLVLPDRRKTSEEDTFFNVNPDSGDLLVRKKIDREELCHGSGACLMELKILAENPLEMHYVAVEIIDVNDHSPRFPKEKQEFEIFEQTSPGGQFQLHAARDPDAGSNSILVATDSGAPSLSSNVTVNVFILDQNDNPPVILYPVSSNGSAEGVEEIPRNVNAGHLVTKVRAYDADIGYNGWLLFSLQEVTDHSLFGLDRYTGQIRTLRSFTETDEAEHKLLILVKDNGNVSLSATATVIVKLVEPKEAFSASDVKSASKDDEENNMIFYLIITLGSVSVLFLISIIVLIAMQCSKSTDYSSKHLQEANYDGTLCHSIQYRSGDKRYMLVGPRMSIGSTIVPGSHANTLVLPDRRKTSEE